MNIILQRLQNEQQESMPFQYIHPHLAKTGQTLMIRCTVVKDIRRYPPISPPQYCTMGFKRGP